jgi:hypothetical protein
MGPVFFLLIVEYAKVAWQNMTMPITEVAQWKMMMAKWCGSWAVQRQECQNVTLKKNWQKQSCESVTHLFSN